MTEPALMLTPIGDGLDAAPDGTGYVTLTQIDIVPSWDGHPSVTAERFLSLSAFHTRRQQHVVFTVKYSLGGAGKNKWMQHPEDRYVAWYPATYRMTAETVCRQNRSHRDRNWTGLTSSHRTYQAGGAVFEPGSAADWDRLHRMLTDQWWTHPCQPARTTGQATIIRHLDAAQTLQSPVAVAARSHPAVIVEQEYSLHFTCRTGRCVELLSGQRQFPATVLPDPHYLAMLYGLLEAQGVGLHQLWTYPDPYQAVLLKAVQTIAQVTARSRPTPTP